MKNVAWMMGALLLACTVFAVGQAKEPVKTKLNTISVADAFADPGKYSGTVGIEGTVDTIDKKSLSFEILTPNPPGSCESDCCAPKRLSVAVPKKEFEGKLPAKEDKVTVVGDFEALTVGFKFVPREVRLAGKAILTRK